MAIQKCLPRALTPYLDGELPQETREQVEEHLRGCAACGALLDEATSARERVRGIGRSLIPATTLMPALELFRERAGIGEARRFDQPDDLPAAPVEEPEASDDARFHALLAGAPLDGVGLVETPGVADDLPAVIDEAEQVTWVAMATPAEAAADDTMVMSPPHIPDPPALPPAAVAEQPPSPVDAAPPAPMPIFEPPPIPELPAIPERFLEDGPRREPGPFSAIVSPSDPVPSPSEAATEPEAPAAPLPWEREEPRTEDDNRLESRPDAPEPQPVPPWVEAEAADADDMEARGRRLVEEDLTAQLALEREAQRAVRGMPPVREPEPEPEPESAPAYEPHVPSLLASDDVATAVASMREELTGPPAPVAADTTIEPLAPRRGTHGGAMPALDRQVKIGIGVAALVAVLVLAAVLVLPRLGTRRANPVAGNAGQASPAVQSTPGATASPAAGAGATPAPSVAPSVPQLTGIITSGAGGTGYRVQRIRSGSPAAGIHRIVFDLEGSGAAPDAQLGRGSDGSLYLQAAGISIDPATIAAFQAVGPISGISATGAPRGLSIKLTSSLAQSPQYSMYYLTGPNRLVIDLK